MSINSTLDRTREKLEESKRDPFKDKTFYDEIVTHVKDEFERRRTVKQPYETLWQLNSDYYDGRQYSYADYSKFTTEDFPQRGRERVIINQIAPVVDTRRAKFVQLNKFMTVMSSTTENDDIKNAEISTQVLQSTYIQLKMDKKFSYATFYSEICGSVFFKNCWDNNAGGICGVDEKGNDVFMGAVSCSVVSPFEIYPENFLKPDINSQGSIIHAQVIPVDEVFYKYGISVSGGTNPVYKVSVVNNTRNGVDYQSSQSMNLTVDNLEDSVIFIEYYEAPTKFYPNGRFIQVCEDKLLYYGDLPYRNNEGETFGFPFVKVDCLPNPTTFFGTSLIPRLIPLQQNYNACQNRINEALARYTIGNLCYERDSITNIDDITEKGIEPGQALELEVGAKTHDFLQSPSLPSDFFNTKSDLKQDIITLSGVSDVSKASNLPSSATSGYAIQILQQQDDTRISLSGRCILDALSEIGTQWLYLYKQFAEAERMVRYTGISYDVCKKWNKAVITSFDVRVADDNNMFANSALTRELATSLKTDGFIGQDRFSRLMYINVLKNGDINKVFQEEFLDVKNAEKENYIFQDENKINEVYDYDDHELHLRTHNIFRKSDWFRDNLNTQQKAVFDNHCKMHEQFINNMKENEVKENE